MKKYYYLNGKMVPSDRGAVSAYDRGIFYGDGLFETVRVYGGRPFLLDRHLERLMRGAAELELNFQGGAIELADAANQLLETNRIEEGYLRLALTRGTGARGLWPANPADQQVTLIITGDSSIPYREEHYEKGFTATMVSFPRNERSPVVRLKSLNFLENILGRREACRRGADEGLFVNGKGHLAEGTVSNLFIVRQGALYTPPVTAGILEGITRNLILEMAEDICDAVIEKNLEPASLYEADEAFLTNSLVEVIALVRVDGHLIGGGKPGKITLKLHQAYHDYRQCYMFYGYGAPKG